MRQLTIRSNQISLYLFILAKQPETQEKASIDLRDFISKLVDNNLGGMQTDMTADVLRGMEDFIAETVCCVVTHALFPLLLLFRSLMSVLRNYPV